MVPDAYRLDRVKVVGIINDKNPPLPPSRVSMFNTGNSSNIPLFILNGVVVEKSIIVQIEPDDLASVNVLREKKATDKYGELAKYGALEITTKRKVSITVHNTTDKVEVPEYADGQRILELQPVYNVVEEMPEYPGGMNALMKFIADNLKFPAQAKTDKVQGTVEVNFFINRNGKVENAKVTKEVHPELDTEAIRLIRLMPDWKPGKLEGKGVDVSYTIPIQFAFK
jgi:TonB family protein